MAHIMHETCWIPSSRQSDVAATDRPSRARTSAWRRSAQKEKKKCVGRKRERESLGCTETALRFGVGLTESENSLQSRLVDVQRVCGRLQEFCFTIACQLLA